METLLERVPQSVVQLSLFLAARRYKRLRVVFYSVLESQVRGQRKKIKP